MESDRFIPKDKYFAAAGARVARNPEDAHVDEFIKLVPGVYSSLSAVEPANMMAQTKFWWLQADNTGGKL